MAFGLRPEAITLICNGVDTDRYSPGHAQDLRVELGVQPGELLIGAVGNIRAPKSYDVLLKAAALVVNRVPRCRFAIIGEGDQTAMQPLAAIVRFLGADFEGRLLLPLAFAKSTPALYRNF